MTNRELDQEMGKQVAIEREASTKILRLIILAEGQKLCGELGYADIADWLIRGHKISERTAYRKIKAARLSQNVSGVLEKIETGRLSVTKVAQVQAAIQTHEKFIGKKLTIENKSQLIDAVETLNGYETERTLVTFFPELAGEAKQTRTTVITPDISRLAINLPNETLDLIKRAKELLSHSIPDGSQAEVIKKVFEDFLDRKDPLRKAEKKKEKIATKAATQGAGMCRSTAADFRETIRKAEGKCEFVDRKTGIVCGSTYQVQIDHIMPKAIGGSDRPENLRCLCRRHNLQMAEVNLGLKANQWRLQ